MLIKRLYIIFLVIIPMVILILKGYFLYAGIFAGVGTIIFLFEKNKKIKELFDKFF